MKNLKLSLFAFVVLLIGGSISVFAQSDRGSIRGTVTDPNGAVVANAKVVLTSQDTNDTRETTTNDQGFYTFPEIRAGLYRVSVEQTGFNRSTVTDFKVAVQVTHTLNIELEVGVTTNEVTVNAETEVLQTDTPVRQTNVSERQVKELPLLVSTESGGRTPLAFIFLDSNINSSGGGNTSATGTADASRFKISGGQALGTEILIDGASTRRTQNGTFFTEVAPGPNAFQEFTVSTSSYSAEYGNSSGGIVNFTLKSGTNEFHGEVYDLLRNEKFNSNSVYNKANNLPRGRDNQNDFGFNIGGPIPFLGFGEGVDPFRLYKDRAFFFFNYEGYRFKQGENVIVTVPTERMRRGDFGELLTDPTILQFFGGPVRIYDPRCPSSSRPVIPNNRLDLVAGPAPAGCIQRPLIDPAGLAILQRFPLPNLPGLFRNYQASSIRPIDMNQFTGKTDFVLTDKQRLTFSYSRRDQERLQGGFPRFPLPFVVQGVWDQTFRSNLFRAQHDYTISSDLINHFNFGYTLFDVANRNTTDPFDTSSLGIPANATQNTAFPRVGFPGYGGNDPRSYQDIGSTFFTDRIEDRAIEVSDYVTYITGRHTFRFGFSYRDSKFDVRQKIDPGGTFNFRHDQTASDADGNGGYPIASLITGATEWAFNFNNSIEPQFKQITQSYFIQDDIKLTTKLTLNLGLRYDLPGLRTEEQGRYRGFSPTVPNPQAGGRPGALVGAAGQGNLPTAPETLARNDKSNIGPRLGAAYAFDNKTVIRGGIGLYYAPILYGIEGGNDLNTGLQGYNSGALFTPDGRNSRFFLSTFPSIPPVAPNDQFIGQDVQFFGDQFRTGRTLQYSVDIQRELPWNFFASVGYIGHRADRLRSNFERLNALPLNALKLGFAILDTNINAVTLDQRAYAQSVGVTIPANGNAVFTGFNGSVAQALKPFPQYNRINNILESEGESEYNALQVKLQRRFAQGIQFGAAYTFSKLITNASEDLFGGSPLAGVIQNPFDIESLKTVSPNNPPHVFVTNFIFEVPFGKGRRYIDKGGLINTLIGGFQVSGVFRYQSGTPIVIFSPPATNPLLDLAGYFGNFRPNLTGQPLTLTTPGFANVRGAAGVILNRAAFAAPPNYRFDAPPFLLNGQVNPAYRTFYSDPTRFFGNAPPVITDVRTDPFFAEDLSVLKKTRITESITIELGAEFFNIFNRVQYNFFNPIDNYTTLDLGRSDFGTKYATRPFDGVANRVIQLRARVIF